MTKGKEKRFSQATLSFATIETALPPGETALADDLRAEAENPLDGVEYASDDIDMQQDSRAELSAVKLALQASDKNARRTIKLSTDTNFYFVLVFNSPHQVARFVEGMGGVWPALYADCRQNTAFLPVIFQTQEQKMAYLTHMDWLQFAESFNFYVFVDGLRVAKFHDIDINQKTVFPGIDGLLLMASVGLELKEVELPDATKSPRTINKRLAARTLT